jgi:hypothetical protein
MTENAPEKKNCLHKILGHNLEAVASRQGEFFMPSLVHRQNVQGRIIHIPAHQSGIP